MDFKRMITALPLLATAATVGACGVLDGAVASQPVWAKDGGIYYLNSRFDAPTELWRTTPDGERTHVRAALPADVQGCDRPDYLADAQLFRWPDGTAGIELACGHEANYFTIDAKGNSLQLVTVLSTTYTMAWTDQGHNGIGAVASCFGFERLVDGQMKSFPPPVTVNGAAVDTHVNGGGSAPCGSHGVGEAAVAPTGAGSWAFLFTPDATSRHQAFDQTATWRVYVWPDGASSPTAIGPEFANAQELDFSDTRNLYAVGTERDPSSSVTIIDGLTGAVTLTVIHATEPTFSPDGTHFAYTTDGPCYCIRISDIP
jgi:hypothetical protein